MNDLINNLMAVGFSPKTVETVKDLKKGTYFQVKLNGPMFVRGNYCRDSKKYSCVYFDDVNRERFFKGDTLVITDAIF